MVVGAVVVSSIGTGAIGTKVGVTIGVKFGGLVPGRVVGADVVVGARVGSAIPTGVVDEIIRSSSVDIFESVSKEPTLSSELWSLVSSVQVLSIKEWR